MYLECWIIIFTFYWLSPFQVPIYNHWWIVRIVAKIKLIQQGSRNIISRLWQQQNWSQRHYHIVERVMSYKHRIIVFPAQENWICRWICCCVFRCWPPVVDIVIIIILPFLTYWTQTLSIFGLFRRAYVMLTCIGYMCIAPSNIILCWLKCTENARWRGRFTLILLFTNLQGLFRT